MRIAALKDRMLVGGDGFQRIPAAQLLAGVGGTQLAGQRKREGRLPGHALDVAGVTAPA